MSQNRRWTDNNSLAVSASEYYTSRRPEPPG